MKEKFIKAIWIIEVLFTIVAGIIFGYTMTAIIIAAIQGGPLMNLLDITEYDSNDIIAVTLSLYFFLYVSYLALSKAYKKLWVRA